MAKELVDQIKRYIQARNLLNQGKQVLSNDATIKDYSARVIDSYNNGTNLDEFEQDINTLETMQKEADTKQDNNATYSFSGERGIAEQFMYNKKYSQLLKDGEEVFSLTSEFNNWKEQLDSAYNNNESLDSFSYSLEMFDALDRAEDNAVYKDEVNNLAKDTESFNEFVTLTDSMNEEYMQPTYTGTDEFNTALNTATANTGDIKMFASAQEEVNYNVEMPETSKGVLRVENGTLENEEELYDGDGIRTPQDLTTQKQEDAREELFFSLVNKCETQEDVDSVVEGFKPSLLQNADYEAYLPVDEEMGTVDNGLGNEISSEVLSMAVNTNTAIMNTTELQPLEEEIDRILHFKLLEAMSSQSGMGAPAEMEP